MGTRRAGPARKRVLRPAQMRPDDVIFYGHYQIDKYMRFHGPQKAYDFAWGTHFFYEYKNRHVVSYYRWRLPEEEVAFIWDVHELYATDAIPPPDVVAACRKRAWVWQLAYDESLMVLGTWPLMHIAYDRQLAMNAVRSVQFVQLLGRGMRVREAWALSGHMCKLTTGMNAPADW